MTEPTQETQPTPVPPVQAVPEATPEPVAEEPKEEVKKVAPKVRDVNPAQPGRGPKSISLGDGVVANRVHMFAMGVNGFNAIEAWPMGPKKLMVRVLGQLFEVECDTTQWTAAMDHNNQILIDKFTRLEKLETQMSALRSLLAL